MKSSKISISSSLAAKLAHHRPSAQRSEGTSGAPLTARTQHDSIGAYRVAKHSSWGAYLSTGQQSVDDHALGLQQGALSEQQDVPRTTGVYGLHAGVEVSESVEGGPAAGQDCLDDADSAYVPKRLPKSSTTAVRALASGAASVQWGRPPPSSTCAQSAQCGLSWSMQALPRAPSASFHRYSGARMSGAVPAHASRFAVVIAAEAPADDPSEPQSPNHKRAKREEARAASGRRTPVRRSSQGADSSDDDSAEDASPAPRDDDPTPEEPHSSSWQPPSCPADPEE